jgi:hypothetical protein
MDMASSPMQGSRLRVASGNHGDGAADWCARGVDYHHTGELLGSTVKASIACWTSVIVLRRGLFADG